MRPDQVLRKKILDEMVFHWYIHGTLLTTEEIANLVGDDSHALPRTLNELRKSLTIMRGRRGYVRLWRVNDIYAENHVRTFYGT